MNGPRNGLCRRTAEAHERAAVTFDRNLPNSETGFDSSDPLSRLAFQRSRMRAGPVLELQARDALEFAFIVCDESEPCGFGVGRDPEIVAADHLTMGF